MMINILDNVGYLYEYQDKEGYELFKWLYDENKKELKIKFKRKFKNADFVRVYLHTSPPLDDLWFYNEYGDEFPIGKVAFNI